MVDNRKSNVTVSIPTFEPNYVFNEGLEKYYELNFDSWLDPDGLFDVTLILCDFKSSDEYKVFLRRYADLHLGKVMVIDGDEVTTSSMAANTGFRLLPYEIGVWVASDTRARDKHWLNLLAEDLKHPEIMASYPTSPIDADVYLDQLQNGPLDRPSRIVPFPDGPIPNVIAFRKDALEPYDNRMSDIFANDTTQGVVTQIAAVGGVPVINMRCNVLHDHYVAGGRFDRSGPNTWFGDVREKEYRQQLTIQKFLPYPRFFLNPGRPPILKPIINGAKEAGLKGILRAIRNRWRQSNFVYVKREIVRKGIWGYLNQTRIVKNKHKALMSLPPFARQNMVRSLFFVDPLCYERLSYQIYPKSEP